ncbi:MAG: hypothetical protein VYA84_20145 [Planctomycetota bacterium]|nr:hypothetical protein [Planctomycetota bacterium]
MIRLVFPLVLLGVVAAEPLRCIGQQSKEGDEFELSFEQFSQKRYSDRQQATLEAWRRREKSRDQVQQATRHPDPEVARRAKWILRQWQLGALPDTPPEISRLLQRSEGPEAIESLLEVGQFTAAIIAIEESAGTPNERAIQQRIASALQRRFPIYVHFALESDSLQPLLELIDLVADSTELAMCRLQLLQQMGTEVPDDELLPRSSVQWPQMEKQRATAAILVALGRVADAIEVAKQTVDPNLLHQCQMIGSMWREAAIGQSQLAEQAEVGGTEYFTRWAMTLIDAERAGDAAFVRRAVDALSGPPVDKTISLGNQWRWQTLASHGFIDEALKIATETNRDDAAKLAMAAARPREALEALGYPLERLDLDLHEWIKRATEKQQSSGAKSVVEEVQNLFSMLEILVSIGRHDAAWEICDQLSKSPVMLGNYRLREFLLLTLTKTRRKDWILEFAVLENDRTISRISLQTIARTLPDADFGTLDAVIQGLTQLLPSQSNRERFQAAYQLMNGEIPSDFNRQQDFERLFRFLTQDPTTSQNGLPRARRRYLANLNIVQLFARHGESELATTTLRQLATRGDAKALFMLAEQELNGGRIQAARELFQAVYDQIVSQGKHQNRIATADDSGLAGKALIGLWTVARRSGDEQLSRELEREIELSLCTPSIATRTLIAEYLGEQGSTSLAIRAFKTMLPIVALGDPENGSFYDVARRYSTLASDTAPSEAAHWFDLAIGGVIESVDFRASAYVTLPMYVHRWALEDAVNRGDEPMATLCLKRIMRLDPLDIDFAERLLPAMRDAGMAKAADRTLDQLINLGIQYSAQFPFDAMSANNLAWVAAMNEKRLEDALELSKLAVTTEPQSAIYRDTLAEILFLLGRREEALQIEKSCLLDDPDQWHLYEQIKKYRQALTEK